MYVIVAGGGALGREVATSLMSRRHDVVVIERVKSICDSLYAEFGVVTVHGSATDLHVLRDAGGARADIVVTAMNNDADNIACALLSRSLGVERVIGRLRDISYEPAFRAAGVTHLIRATQLLRNQVVLHVDHPKVEEIVSIGHEDAQIFSVHVPVEAWCVGRSVSEVAHDREFPRDCLLVGLRRVDEEGIHIPRGDSEIRSGDEVLSIATGGSIEQLLRVLTRSS